MPVFGIPAASSDFEIRLLHRQSARHRRQRVPGTGLMLLPSLQVYQACPLSKPGIDLRILNVVRLILVKSYRPFAARHP